MKSKHLKANKDYILAAIQRTPDEPAATQAPPSVDAQAQTKQAPEYSPPSIYVPSYHTQPRAQYQNEPMMAAVQKCPEDFRRKLIKILVQARLGSENEPAEGKKSHEVKINWNGEAPIWWPWNVKFKTPSQLSQCDVVIVIYELLCWIVDAPEQQFAMLSNWAVFTSNLNMRDFKGLMLKYRGQAIVSQDSKGGLSQEQRRAYEQLKAGSNTLILGRPGTGKVHTVS